MARWTGHPEIVAVLEGAEAWRDRCLLADGSLFSDRSLWSQQNVAELHQRFVDNPIEGSDQRFYDKLAAQIAPAAPAIKQLAAEALWFTILFPNTFGAEAKRLRIEEAWAWSGEALAPTTPYLEADYLAGVGNPGTGYMTRLPQEFGFLLDAVRRWKENPGVVPAVDHSDQSAWAFAAWLDGVPDANHRPMRNALLFFLFPDQFERNLSAGHRLEIYTALKNSLDASDRVDVNNTSLLKLDQSILKIRKLLESRLGSHELDFYLPPIKSMWKTDERDQRRKNLASALESIVGNYNLDVNQAGSKKRLLQDTREVSESTGYWADPTDATNKPLRWLLHLDLRGGDVKAKLPQQEDGTLRHGARRIAFVNTAQGRSGTVLVRIIPAMQVADDHYEFFETWEWLLMLNFLPNLPIGSAAQLLEDFDPATGILTYMGSTQPYISAALIGLNDEGASYTTEVAGSVRTVTYAEATKALTDLLHIRDGLNRDEAPAVAKDPIHD